jgi:RimJ/RimL family protein N-acetyltransferase
MPHIVGSRVYLREYRMEDLEAIYQWRTLDEIVWWTAAYVWPESLEQARAFLEGQVRNTDPANRKFAICLREDNRYVGHIGYEHLDLRRRNTELGIVLGYPDMLSKGIGTEAIRLFLRVCFEELGLHRVGLRVLRANERGIRCYEKCGFKEEGSLREWHYSRGRWHDLVLMSILEDEYRATTEAAPLPDL